MSLLGLSGRSSRALRPRRRRSAWAAVRWPVLAYVPAAVALARLRRRVGVPPPVTNLAVAGAPLAVALAAPATKWRHAAVWATHMWAYKIAFEVPYDRPEKLRERLHVRYPIEVDARLAGGTTPTERLQRALRRPPRLTALDWALTVVYWTWEAVPHLALAWILVRHDERFGRAAGRLAAAFDLTTVGYWTVPTAPPWWASEVEGEMDGVVRRVGIEIGRALRGESRPQETHLEGANPWASMPSDHFGSTAMVAMLLSEIDPLAGAAGWTYAALLGFALVYLGEHYVTDLLAGLALAEGVRRAEPAARPLARRAAAAVNALSPRIR